MNPGCRNANFPLRRGNFTLYDIFDHLTDPFNTPPPGPPCRGGGPGRGGRGGLGRHHHHHHHRRDDHRHPHGPPHGPPPFHKHDKDIVEVSPIDSEFNDDDLNAPMLVDVYDLPHGLSIKALLPGIKQSDIDVDFDSKTRELTIVANHTSPPEYDEDGIVYEDIPKAQQLVRHVALADKYPLVDDSNIKAELENGILTVTIPKVHADESVKRRVPVTVPQDEEQNEKDVEDEPETETEAADHDEAMDSDSVLVEKDNLN